jgi:hypothetical protein
MVDHDPVPACQKPLCFLGASFEKWIAQDQFRAVTPNCAVLHKVGSGAGDTSLAPGRSTQWLLVLFSVKLAAVSGNIWAFQATQAAASF